MANTANSHDTQSQI